MDENLLIEVSELNYTLSELNEDGKPKKLKITGTFGKYDEENGNKRKYPKLVLENAIKGILPMVNERRMMGELDHPPDAKVHLEKVSHLITKLEVRDNGEIYGEAEVLPTASGKILESLLKSNVKLGISSRGFGSTKDVGGIQEVQDDYRLVTFDVVNDPSTPGAFPKPVYENKDQKKDTPEYVTNLDALVESVLETEIPTSREKKDFICMDEDSNRFYIVEGEHDSYGTLNFHISHKYHVLIKNKDFHEELGLSDVNLQLVEDIYGKKVISKIREKIASVGYDPQTLNIIKEESK